MKNYKYGIMAGVCLVAALGLAGCGSKQQTATETQAAETKESFETISESALQELIETESFDMEDSELMEIGDMRISLEGNTLKLEFAENPTTGYIWTCTSSDEEVLKKTEDNYVQDKAEDEDGEPLDGVGGIHYMTFTSGKAGDVEISLVYGRTGDEPETEKVLRLTVAEDGTLGYTQN